MLNIDRLAYQSKLKTTDPMEKLFFSMAILFTGLWADNIVVSIIILFIMIGVSAAKGHTPFLVFIRLLLIPMTFLMTGVITIALSWKVQKSTFIASIPFFNGYIGFTPVGLLQASVLFFKALGAVSCLYFLSLSTPIVDLLLALKRLKLPKILVELMGLIYRFIFILLGTADTMYIAQNARLGYSSIKSGYRSLGALVSTLFIIAFKRSYNLYTAMESRGYTGEINVLENAYNKHPIWYGSAAIISVLLIAFSYFLN